MISMKKIRKRGTVLITSRTREMTGATATVDLIVLRKSIVTGMTTTGAAKVERNQIIMGRAGDMTEITEITAGVTVGAHKGGVGLRKKMKDTEPRNRVIGARAGNVGCLKAGEEIIALANRVAGIAAEAAAHVDENKSPNERSARDFSQGKVSFSGQKVMHAEWPLPFNHSSLKNMNSGSNDVFK